MDYLLEYMSGIILHSDIEIRIYAPHMNISHLFWAGHWGDLLLIASDIIVGKVWMAGLVKLSPQNHAITNVIKTKCIAFGNDI